MSGTFFDSSMMAVTLSLRQRLGRREKKDSGVIFNRQQVSAGREQYQSIINEHAQQDWWLIQVFAPGIGVYGAAKYYELIFEREL